MQINFFCNAWLFVGGVLEDFENSWILQFVLLHTVVLGNSLVDFLLYSCGVPKVWLEDMPPCFDVVLTLDVP